MKLLTTLFFIGACFLNSYAQTASEKCHFDHKLEETKSNSTDAELEFNAINANIEEIIANNKLYKGPLDVYTIPVVVHIIHKGEPVGTGTNISDAQINSAITNLTDTYRDAFGNSIDNLIEFQLAVRDPNCAATNGIVRVDGTGVPGYSADGITAGGPGAVENDVKDLSKWPTDQYMNFWIVSEIDGNNGGFGIQGYANFPFAGDPYNGAVMMASIFGYDPTSAFPAFNLNAPRDNSTAIHEVGHFLSLYHTFQGDNNGTICPGNVTTGTDSDGCADTSPHIRNASTCPANGTNNPCFAGTLDEVKLNYMDYSSCPIKFTSDQKDRMRACLEGPRLSLVTSLALTPPASPFTAPIAAVCTPTTQAIGLSGGFGGITSVIFSNLNSPTSSTNTDGGYMDFTGECLKVAYVDLNQVVPLTINTWFNDHDVKVWIDYNNDGDFDDAGEEVFDQALTGGTPTTVNVTIPAAGGATIDTYLRMRVLGDLNPVPNSCSDPEYGQAEDYVVYITDPAAATPVADFSVDDVTPCVNQEITFDDLSTNTPTSWAWIITPAIGWSYTGGTSATDENPQVTFTTAGDYDVQLTATNASGTDDEIKTTYITVHASPTVALTPTNTSCGQDNGQIVAVVSGNTGAPTYAWASGSTTDTQTGLAVGNETLVVTVDGCTINDDDDIAADTAPTVTLTPTQPTCGLNNGQIVAVVAGNTGAPTYAWASGSATDTQTGLAAGNETLVVTVDGCTLNDDETLTAVAAPTVTLTPTQPTCGLNNGQLVAVVAGNTGVPTYAWASGSTTDTQTGLGAGNETLVVTVDGCTINDDETLTAVPTPTVTLTPTDATCGLNNGQIVAVVSGNTGAPTYAWASGSTTDTQTGLGAGNETLVVTVDGCTLNDDETLTASAAPTITLTPTNTSCGLDNGQIIAVVAGNTGVPTYAWASGSTTDTQTGLAVGNETLVVTVDGCTINEDDDIAADAAPTVTLTPTQPTCGLNNGQIVAVVAGNTGAPTYTWASGSTTDTQTGLGAGNESLVVTVDGCTLNEDETLTAVASPTVTLTPTQPTCGLNNGQIIAVVSGNTGAPTYVWASGSTTDTQTGLGAGNETLVVTVDGCTINEDETLTAVPTPTVTLTPTDATCGLNNGQIIAVVSGNTGAPTYAWASGSTTDTQTGLGAGNETLVVTVDGCTLNDDETLTSSAAPTVTLTPTNATCGLNNGQIVAVVAGNTGVPTYAWASGSTTDTQTGLGAGNETLVINVDGCTINDDETLTISAAPTATLTPSNATCGLNNGQVVAVVSGNTGAPTYAWANGSTTDTQTGLAPGNETLVITVDGCTLNENETILATATPTVTLTPTNTSCGQDNGQIVAVVSGNTGAPTYAWASGSTTDTQTGLAVGNETLVVTVDGCTINDDDDIAADAAPTVTLTPTDATCGLNNGQIVAVVSGNTGAPNYAWASGSTTDTQTGLGAGNETLVVTVDGCTLNDDETLTASAAPTVTLTPTNATCGLNNGQITATVTGNTGTPTFNWASGSTTDTQTGLGAGNETLVINVDGCTINDDETLTISAAPTATLTPSNATCGLNNGQIIAVVSGNTSAPTYAWANGSTTDTQTGLAAGNETLIITVDGCTLNENETIIATATPTVALTPTNTSCGQDNGQIVAVVSGNTGAPTYAWASGSTTDTQTGLAVGNETLVVTVDGCTINDDDDIAADTAPTVTLTPTQPTCGLNNGQIVAVVAGNTGAPTYAWASGSATDTQTGLAAGNETLVVTVDGCTLNDDETLTAVATPTVTLTPTQPTCGLNNGQLVAVVAGNTGVPTYAWASGSTTDTQTGLGAGNETLVVTVDGCTINDDETLTAVPTPTVTLTPTDATCGLNNGQIVAVVSGNTGAPTYAWASGSTTDTQTGLGAGNETLVVTVDGCTLNDDETLTASAAPTITLTPTNTSCGLDNGQIIAVVAGNTGVPTYAWASGSTTDTQTGLAVGNETLVVTVDGCTINEDDDIAADAAPTVTLTPTQPTCGLNNGQIVAVVAGNTGAPTYTWASGSTTDTQTGLGAGNESLVVTVDGCTLNEDETLTAVASPTVTLTPTQPTCGLNNGQIIAVVSGNTGAPTYVWASGSTTDTQTGLGAGNETLVVTVDGCTINEDETLTAVPTPAVTLTPTDATCGLNNGQIIAVVSGNTGAPTYAWASGSTTDTQTGLGAGNETLVVTVDGCTINDDETLTASAAPTVTLTPTNATCGLNNGQIIATVTGNTGTPTFNWASGSTTATQLWLGAGSETLVVTVDGCTINENEIITTTPGSNGGIIGGPTTICSNTSPGIINSSNYDGEIVNWIYSTDQVNWTELDSLNDLFTANPITETTWFGLIVELGSCPTDTSFIEITTLSLPDVDAGDDQTIDQGNSTLIEGITTETNFVWTPNENIVDNFMLSTTITPDSSVIYTLTATDNNGCVNSDSLEITVLTDWDYMTGIHVPNGFSPNNDGHNDYLDIFVGNDISSFNFILYDRWGKVIFTTDSEDFLWDGTHRTKPVNTGVYAYTVEVELNDGSNTIVNGNVTLIR